MSHNDFLPALNPAYPDPKSCDAWLATAALGDSHHACAAFLSLLGEIEGAPPPRQTYLQMLEHLLPRLLAAISEQTRKFAAKPLPLSSAEALAFRQVTDLWLALLRAYRRLLRAAVDAAAQGSDATLALLAARSTACACELIAAHYLARREPGTDLWQWLHVSYAFAEARGLSDARAGNGHGNSCAVAYAQAMLFALAHPQSLAQRDMFWTRAWARRFADKVQVARSAPAHGAYAVDLGGGSTAAWRASAEPANGPGDDDSPLRFLDTQALGHALRKRLRRLDEGEDPSALGLGQGCTQPGTGALLRRLLTRWCAAPAAPRFPRRSVASHQAEALVTVGFTATHAALYGRAFTNQARDWDYGRPDADEGVLQHAHAQQERVAVLRVERWRAVDESACGFRLHRSGSGARVAHRQLLALKAGGAPKFLLVEVRWMVQEAADELAFGVQLMPGLAHASAVRLCSEDPARQQAYSQAFLLPQAQGAAPSLILPMGWYQRDRLLDLRLEAGPVRIRLFGLADRGFDYDRVNFAAEG